MTKSRFWKSEFQLKLSCKIHSQNSTINKSSAALLHILLSGKKMAKICYIIFASFFLALANCQGDLLSPSLVSSSSCSEIIYEMIDCISFLTGVGGSAAKPDALCCSGFKSVLKADAHCICQAIREAPQMGIKLNKTRAIELPSDCEVSHFSASKICGCKCLFNSFQ